MVDKQRRTWTEGDGAFIRTELMLEPMPVISDDDAVPKRVKAMPWGETELRDKAAREFWDEPGTLEVNARTATEVIDNFGHRDTDYFVNLNHNRGPNPGKAYGWIESVSVIPNEGIHIDVDWTAEGEALVRDRAYRYSSIEVILDGSQWLIDGSPAVVVAVVGLALTNNPAVVGQAPVAYQSLNAALSCSDGRDIGQRPEHLGSSEEKGHPLMDGKFITGLLARAFGREPNDEFDAATMASELKVIRESHEQLTADLATQTSLVVELTEKLATAESTISEFKTAEAEAAKAGEHAKLEAAVKDGRLHMAQLDEAKKDPAAVLAVADKTPPKTFSPPDGRVVTDGVIADASAAIITCDETAMLQAEIKTYQEANPEVPYDKAWLAVKKAHEATAGKGV